VQCVRAKESARTDCAILACWQPFINPEMRFSHRSPPKNTFRHTCPMVFSFVLLSVNFLFSQQENCSRRDAEAQRTTKKMNMDEQDFCFLSCQSCASMLRKDFEVLCASVSLREKWVGFFSCGSCFSWSSCLVWLRLCCARFFMVKGFLAVTPSTPHPAPR
jgi:hypothetical protein